METLTRCCHLLLRMGLFVSFLANMHATEKNGVNHFQTDWLEASMSHLFLWTYLATRHRLRSMMRQRFGKVIGRPWKDSLHGWIPKGSDDRALVSTQCRRMCRLHRGLSPRDVSSSSSDTRRGRATIRARGQLLHRCDHRPGNQPLVGYSRWLVRWMAVAATGTASAGVSIYYDGVGSKVAIR